MVSESRLLLRREVPADAAAISAVTAAAFAEVPYSDNSEPAIVEALRAAGALTLSLVAEMEGEIVGHVAVSPVVISDGTAGWYGLGPVSVAPCRQGRGIGAGLVRRALAMLGEAGAAGCVVLGDPAYYGRFGFAVADGLVYPGAPAPYFQALSLGGPVPRGEVAYHPAFGGSG